MPKPSNKLTTNQLGQLIYEIRGERVMLDSDLASIYGVETKALNRAVKRNRDDVVCGERYFSRLTVTFIGGKQFSRTKKSYGNRGKLSPLLLVRDPSHLKLVIADGYHRMCAVYLFDEDTRVPCKIV